MPVNPMVRIVLLFCILYGITLASAALVFEVQWPGVLGTLSIFMFYTLSLFSILIGARVQTRDRGLHKVSFSRSKLDGFFDTCLLLVAFATMYGWSLILSYYGGILVVIAHAFDIRESSIGGQESVVPPFITYACSPIYAVWVYELARKECTGKVRKLRIGLAFLCIVLIDLMSFGRVGILFSLMSALAWYGSKSRRIQLRSIMLIVCVFGVSMMPRLLRGDFDNFEESMERYRPSMRIQIPESLNFAVALLPYYSGSFFSAGKLIDNVDESAPIEGGIRTFTPLVNAYNRLVGSQRVVNIDAIVEVPFEHNVHGLQWDLLRDFGVYGFFPAALLWGLALGAAASQQRSTIGLATIYFVGAVIFFFPVYSLISFGGFFIAFSLLLILKFIERARLWT